MSPRPSSWTARGLALAALGIGLFGILAWLAGRGGLTSVVPGRPPMMPLTAVAITVIAAAALARLGGAPGRRLPAQIAGIAVAVVGALTLGAYAAGLGFPFERLLPAPGIGPHPGRPSPLTAVALMFLGSAVVFLDAGRERTPRPSEWLTAPALLVGLMTLVGHAYGAGLLYQLPGMTTIGTSLPTAIALLLVSGSLLAGRPDQGLMRYVTSPRPGGRLLRRLATAGVLVPVLAGLFVWQLHDSGVDLPLTLGALTTAMIVIQIGLLLFTAPPLEAAHAAVEAGRERLHTFVEQAPLGIFVADLEGRYTDVNAAGCDLLRAPREAIVGKTILDLLAPEEAERLWAERERLAHGVGLRSSWRLRRADGSFVPVEVTAHILPDGRWQAFVVDITQRLAVEEERRRAAERLDGIIAIAADAIIAVDDDDRIVIYNRAAALIFGWTHDEAMGRPLDFLLPERFHAVHRQHVAGFRVNAGAARRMAGESINVSGRRKNGDEFPAEASISRLVTDEASLVTVVLRDVSGRAAMERALRASLREKEILLRELHHRVKNNLQVVSSLLNLQAQRVETPGIRELCADSQARVQAIALVHDRLYRSPDLSHVDFDDYLQVLVDNLRHAASADLRGIQAKLTRGGVRLPVDTAVPCGMLVNELVTNALKHAFPGGQAGTLELGLRAEDGRLELWVQDDGIGLPAALDPRRATSLGLDLVFTFAEQLGAEVEVRRDNGTGFRFSFAAPG